MNTEACSFTYLLVVDAADVEGEPENLALHAVSTAFLGSSVPDAGFTTTPQGSEPIICPAQPHLLLHFWMHSSTEFHCLFVHAGPARAPGSAEKAMAIAMTGSVIRAMVGYTRVGGTRRKRRVEKNECREALVL